MIFLIFASVSAAERLYDKLHKAVYSLDYNPEMYPIYTPLEPPIDITYRYMLCTKRYRIVFRIIGDDVYVSDVQDCRQNTDKHIV